MLAKRKEQIRRMPDAWVAIGDRPTLEEIAAIDEDFRREQSTRKSNPPAEPDPESMLTPAPKSDPRREQSRALGRARSRGGDIWWINWARRGRPIYFDFGESGETKSDHLLPSCRPYPWGRKAMEWHEGEDPGWHDAVKAFEGNST